MVWIPMACSQDGGGGGGGESVLVVYKSYCSLRCIGSWDIIKLCIIIASFSHSHSLFVNIVYYLGRPCIGDLQHALQAASEQQCRGISMALITLQSHVHKDKRQVLL